MKAVILAGGLGTRLSPIATDCPKPMVRIGPQPILWHIMKLYGHHHVRDFIICLGYLGQTIKDYFLHYHAHHQNLRLDLQTGTVTYLPGNTEPWTVSLVDTGLDTQTGGRLERVQIYVQDDPCFFMTYGDAVSDLDLSATLAFHQTHGKPATVTAVRPAGRFGHLTLDGNAARTFITPTHDPVWINGGFFVLNPSIFDLIEDDHTVWEEEPLQTLAANNQLAAYQHGGFWHCMDTPKDYLHLKTLCEKGKPPWQTWASPGPASVSS